jgi:hypothetical protein
MNYFILAISLLQNEMIHYVTIIDQFKNRICLFFYLEKFGNPYFSVTYYGTSFVFDNNFLMS